MYVYDRRGIGNLIRHHILSHPAGTPLHFYCSSSGNAGLGCVTAARKLGYAATVVVGHNTKPLMISKLRNAGATRVVQVGASWAEADRHLREVELANDPHGIYVPPFEHEKIWEGASMMIDEIKEQLPDDDDLDAVVLSVGGGGLFIGAMQGLDRNYGRDTPVIAMETKGADSLNQSLKAGELITLPAITSIAASLGALRVSPTALKEAQRPNVKSFVIEDKEAAMGCWRFLDDERMMVEPSCGAALAVCYDGKLKKFLPSLKPWSKVVIVVCGGSSMTMDLLAEYKSTYGGLDEGTRDPVVPSSITEAEWQVMSL